jgi:hypothetical protein
VVVISKIMLHTGNHVAEITPNDVVDYHRAAARCAMVHRWRIERGTGPWWSPARAGRSSPSRSRYDRARASLDRHATYIVAAYIAGAAR